METTSEAIMVSVLPKSVIMKETPGANMAEASGLMKVMVDSSAMTQILRLSSQFRGSSGSSMPSQPTMFWERFCSGCE